MADGMHREDIKAALRKRHGTVRAFELARKLPDRSVRDVLRGRAVAQTEQALSTELGKPLHVLFPLRYEAPDASQGDDSSPTGDDSRGSTTRAHRLSAGAR